MIADFIVLVVPAVSLFWDEYLVSWWLTQLAVVLVADILYMVHYTTDKDRFFFMGLLLLQILIIGQYSWRWKRLRARPQGEVVQFTTERYTLYQSTIDSTVLDKTGPSFYIQDADDDEDSKPSHDRISAPVLATLLLLSPVQTELAPLFTTTDPAPQLLYLAFTCLALSKMIELTNRSLHPHPNKLKYFFYNSFQTVLFAISLISPSIIIPSVPSNLIILILQVILTVQSAIYLVSGQIAEN